MPLCPGPQCRPPVHRHGSYERFWIRGEIKSVRVQRYLCPVCQRTFSVLPSDSLPYRPLSVALVEEEFDRRAQEDQSPQSGPDPPPSVVEEGCLQRAWIRFSARSERLRQCLGHLVPATAKVATTLWQAMRRSLGPLQAILAHLAVACECSLFGDYVCLQQGIRSSL